MYLCCQSDYVLTSPQWYEERKAAITTIQAQYRGAVRRYQYKQLLQRRFDAASLIQARSRGMAERKRYQETLRRREASSIMLQRQWRGRMVGWLVGYGYLVGCMVLHMVRARFLARRKYHMERFTTCPISLFSMSSSLPFHRVYHTD